MSLIDLKSSMPKIFIMLWVPVVLVLLSLLTAQHILTIPAPPISSELQTKVAKLRPAHASGWFLVHVLLKDCKCSSDVSANLLGRGPILSAHEHIVLVGDQPIFLQQALEKGFSVSNISSDDLASQFSINVTPLLLILSPENKLVYAGGYYDRYARTEARDVQIFEQIKHRETVSPLPTFGCAVSRKLRSAMDPFGLKYSDYDPKQETTP